MKLDAARAESQTQTKEALRRRDMEAETRLREQEAGLRKEMQQKEEAALARARQHEADLVAQLTAQAEAQKAAAKAEWDAQFETKTRLFIEPFRVQLARAEKAIEARLESLRTRSAGGAAAGVTQSRTRPRARRKIA